MRARQKNEKKRKKIGREGEKKKHCKTRTSKRQKKSRIEDEAVLCGVCLEEWKEKTEEEEIWIGCERCKDWFHAACIDIDPNNETDYVCESCITPN